LKSQALRHGPDGTKDLAVGGTPDTATVAVATPIQGDGDFLDLPREEQIDHVWESLLGQGLLDKDAAIRNAAQILRDRGLARFQRLREGGPLYEVIATALDRGVREGSFDRPKRGHVRAILPDAKGYSAKDWKLCVLRSLDGDAVPEEEALRNAAEWARENLGLGFARLRKDGVILRGLRTTLEEAVKAGEVIRKRGEVARTSSP